MAIYWLVTYFWFYFLYCLSALFLILSGLALRACSCPFHLCTFNLTLFMGV